MVIAIAHSPLSERHLSPGDTRLEQLRHSLAKSPSKVNTSFQLFSSTPSPPPQSPPSFQPEIFSDVPLTLFPISAKKKKPALRHMSPLRISRGSLNFQRPRRILQESSDQGNSALQLVTFPATSPNEMQISPDENTLLAPHHALGRREKSGYFDLAKSSPLKRSESNFDIAQASSPSAKKRSVYGSGFGMEANIPEHDHLYEEGSDLPTPTPQYSPLPRRMNSAKKLNLTARFDTLPAIKSKPTVGSIWDIQAAKAKNRLSLDFPIPDNNDESPFSFDITNQSPKELPTLGKLTLPPRHPLSRTITQSSSSSDIAEDSPTHPPIRNLGDFRRPFPEFTRSLPLGVARPRDDPQDSDESNFTTPASYRLAKPHPAAFLSTGLISKRNRNLTNEQLENGTSLGDMPDTPCKRPLAIATPIPMPTPNVNLLKTRTARHSLHAFGTPSAPFNPQNSSTYTGFGPSIFGSEFNRSSSRRGSFADNIETIFEPPSLSFCERIEEIPKETLTPTKQGLQLGTLDNVNDGSATMDSKLISQLPGTEVDGYDELDDNCLISPSPKLRFQDSSTIPSFSKRQARGRKHCPSPLSSLSSPLPSKQTKSFPTASPLVNPTTPHEPAAVPVLPPDPSNLSISAPGEKRKLFIRHPSFHDSLTVNLPATPTAVRDSSGKFSSFGTSVTPSHHSAPFNVDSSITSRFDKIEPLSSGEFSQVWRVYSFAKSGHSKTVSRRDSKGIPAASSVWVVKKAKNAYIGPRDRIRRLQEVETLKALGQANHTIQFIDHWEYQDHLYIQTEYCEEGTLSSFLMRAGQSARLDDFRIWKIMLEISKGLKHIHDSGFIHLDIKPANILVSFEGVLKIGDFGMSCTWPAPPNIEGEGDREYIGPEILKGQFDKPADVFAFGLLMLEIAGNVMLPDNGTAWQRLRSGDMSDVPSLTSSSDISNISRDISGNPVSSPVKSVNTGFQSDPSLAAFDFGFEPKLPSPGKGHRLGELRNPPVFMLDAEHASALDKIVRWMISPEPSQRPVVNDLLATEGVRWVEARRRAGATIYEGNFGPADEVLNHDSEMIDV